ncbi:recombinase family protein [Arthrobacter sp. UYEF36]|uniref:recombinase family protein n=1 Tax=Arthrobacter sp. UYEF36 TaxID=1756366 RepID=UPI0033987626
MTTSAVYLRISKDKGLGTEDEGLAVDRQRKDIHKLLKVKGWEVGTEYLDNDVSASGKVKRPAYEQMLEDFEAGEIDAITAWKLDRLWRVPMELEHIIQLVEKSSLTVATTDSDIDLATSGGRVMARILTTFAQDELDKRSARQKAKFAQDREAGKNHWRGRRPFGLTLDGKLVEKEAKALQDIAGNLLDGGTVSAAVELLNSRGVLTTFGQEWQRQPLRRTLLNPRVAGLLEHEGELLPGRWDAVLDKDTWDAVVAVLKTPGRAKPKQTRQEYLLSGLLTCGECKGKCYGRRTLRKLKSGTYRVGYIYRCAEDHASKTMTRTDDLVIMNTLSAFLNLDVKEVEADKEALKALREARAAEVKRWSDFQQDAAEDEWTPSQYRLPRKTHETKLADLNRQITELEKVSLVRMPTVEELAESTADENGEIVYVFEWDRMTLEKRRRLVESVWKSITLKKTKRGARWSDENVVMVPRKL